jgi:ribosomal protein S18 acetylase RimI-like enzyme
VRRLDQQYGGFNRNRGKYGRLNLIAHSHLKIRELGASDAADFQALRLQSLLEFPSAFSSSHSEECDLSLSVVAERIAPTPHGCVFGAFAESQFVGILGLAREKPQKLAHKAFIWGMFVAPRYRVSGIGRTLVQTAIAKAAAMSGVRQINLGVNAKNTAALELYRSCGFEQFGLEREFMLLNGELHDEIHMVHFLNSTNENEQVAKEN